MDVLTVRTMLAYWGARWRCDSWRSPYGQPMPRICSKSAAACGSLTGKYNYKRKYNPARPMTEKVIISLAALVSLAVLPLPAHSQWNGNGSQTWQQRNAEAQMREDMRKETQRQIQENNRKMQQQNNQYQRNY